MDDTLKTKWIDALRSGNYEQGKEYLRKDNSYCCIGVLCEIAGADMSGAAHEIPGEGDEETRCVVPTAFFDEENYTTDEELGGLIHYFKIGTKVESILIKMNDGGTSFQEIADWIEARDLQSGRPLPSSEPASGSNIITDGKR